MIKNCTIIKDAKTWIGDLLYENGVHQRETNIFNNAEKALEKFLEEMRIQGAVDYIHTINRGAKEKGGYTNKDVLFLRKVNKKNE